MRIIERLLGSPQPPIEKTHLPPQHPEERQFGYFVRKTLPLSLRNRKTHDWVVFGGMERFKRVYGPLLKAREQEIREAMEKGLLTLHVTDHIGMEFTTAGDDVVYLTESTKDLIRPRISWLLYRPPKGTIDQFKKRHQELKRDAQEIKLEDLGKLLL